MITQERLRELLHYNPDTGAFTWIKSRGGTARVGKVAGSNDTYGYSMIKIDHVSYLAHRLAWLWVYGVWTDNEIDHINGDRADNRIANLREATRSQNMRNRGRQRNNTSGYKGVTWDRRHSKWHAQINSSSKKLCLGYFASAEEAHRAYNAAAVRLHGEFINTGSTS